MCTLVLFLNWQLLGGRNYNWRGSSEIVKYCTHIILKFTNKFSSYVPTCDNYYNLQLAEPGLGLSETVTELEWPLTLNLTQTSTVGELSLASTGLVVNWKSVTAAIVNYRKLNYRIMHIAYHLWYWVQQHSLQKHLKCNYLGKNRLLAPRKLWE